PLRVELRREQPGAPKAFELEADGAGADGVYQYKAEGVDLYRGPNLLRAVAVNAGGPAEARVAVSFLPEPAELLIDEVQPEGGASLKPVRQTDGRFTFDRPAAAARVVVRGRVIWARPDDEQAAAAETVRIHVNGFQQPPEHLRAMGAAAPDGA